MKSPLDYFRLIEASIDEVLWLVSPDEKELYYISPAWERLTGISCQSLYDDPTIWKEALHPEDRARLEEISQRPSERRLDGNRSNEFRFLHPDGSIRWVWLRSRPVYDEQGNLIARCGSAVDVTERRSALELLTESEATYKQLFDSVMEGIGIVDENEVIQVCNQAFVNIFEEDSEADMIGKSLLDMVPADQVELILSQTPQRRQNVSSQYEVNIITKRGNQKTVLASIVHRYRGYDIRRFYRGDAGFANPDLYSYLETEGYFYAIRLKANAILYGEVEHLLTRPVGRPPKKPIVQYYSFRYQAASWDTARRVVAKVEWHAGGLFPRVGFIVTNLRWRSANVVKFYNRRGTAEQWIKEGKYALNWTRLSCHDFVDNQVRLQLFALAYNLGNFLRQLALPKSVKEWSLRTLREKLIKIGAKVVRHARYVTFQMAEVLVSRSLFYDILKRIGRLKPAPVSIS